MHFLALMALWVDACQCSCAYVHEEGEPWCEEVKKQNLICQTRPSLGASYSGPHLWHFKGLHLFLNDERIMLFTIEEWNQGHIVELYPIHNMEWWTPLRKTNFDKDNVWGRALV